ncbi:mitochondrial outer membrane protein [Sphaerosporella brunnea]|uniref:Mitochondrial outer membrane protein n=1 Tax=Sphaerosporella brunnea TaxID=1250544 RepID=A0A5J5EED8_9PEZI|nr:mitochondrial outer membrane protein [Sphaerosporella brunnea]
MSSPLARDDDDVFERLKSAVDPAVVSEREKAVQERVRLQYEKAQRRLAELIEENSTLPVTIADIRIHGVKNTREGFLHKVFADALKEEKQRSYTLNSALEELQKTTQKLHRFGIFHPNISMYLDQAHAAFGDRTPISAFISVQERGRLQLNTGTEVGNAEGGGYFNATIRNVFGGAETLYASASTATSTADVGHRTRSSYELTFATPINADPDTVFDIGAFRASRSNHYFASHEEAQQGVRAGLRFLTDYGSHELNYNGVWRQVSNLSPDASPSVRADAGDSVKSSITHTLTRDTRDSKLLPTTGSLLKGITELAGLGGDVSFLKTQVEAQRSLPFSHGISFSTGLRAGVLVPLPQGLGFSENATPPRPSRINDRFFLGGATDIRGFRENGLGPRDGNDAVGGDVYVAGGASLFLPLPRLGAESPFRLQAFVNGGRLVALQQSTGVKEGLLGALREMGVGYPSMAAGVGLVYAHPVARFELNFALPVVKREEERARKGLQFGVGISFL